MKSFSFDLNIGVQAKDLEEALAIAEAIKALIEQRSEYKVDYIDIDDVEEN